MKQYRHLMMEPMVWRDNWGHHMDLVVLNERDKYKSVDFIFDIDELRRLRNAITAHLMKERETRNAEKLVTDEKSDS